MNTPLSPIMVSIIAILAGCGGSCPTIDIVHAYQKRRKNTPKQTVYRALTAIRNREIITTTKGITSTSSIWTGRMRSMLDQMESGQIFAEFPKKLSLSFPSIWSAAPVLAHYANILTLNASKDSPIIWINPHQWFYVVRPWSEDQLIQNIIDSGHQLLQGIIHRSPVGTAIIQNRFNKDSRVRASYIDAKIGMNDTYIAIIGDYVVTTVFSSELNRQIDDWFRIHKATAPEGTAELQSIIRSNSTVKITFKHDPKAALHYQKHMTKFFG